MKISLLTSAIALAIIAGSVNAACGGGGNKKATSSSTALQTPLPVAEIVDLNESATVMSVSAGPIRQIVRFDTTQFDKLSPTMQLNKNQRKEISATKAQIQTRSEALKSALINAQTALLNCQGRCDAEVKKLEAATREINKFDPNQAFADRLSHILNPDQIAQLESSDRVNKHQGS